MKHPVLVGLGVACAAGLACTALIAGPLDPPLGPVSSSYKTLSEVEPRIALDQTSTPGDEDSVFRIVQPGSYYLTANLIGQEARHGIEIAADNVTIDLRGFTLSGEGIGSLTGIVADQTGQYQTIRVTNGSVVSWSQNGINLSNVVNASVDRVHARSNVGTGIELGRQAMVESCVAQSNGAHGIAILQNSQVRHCLATLNSQCGFRQTADQTDGSGARFESCEASLNGTYGIHAANGAVIANCRANSNTGGGVLAAAAATVSGTMASSNDAVGIQVGDQSIVADCSADTNRSHGISVAARCRVSRNRCTFNGSIGSIGAGIHADASAFYSLIEDNHCASNDRGFWITASGNIIVRNSAAGSDLENYNVVAGNRLAPVVFGGFAPAMQGSTGGAPLGSTDPNANFAY